MRSNLRMGLVALALGVSAVSAAPIGPNPKYKGIHVRRSKYMPHQGKKECERRMRQMNRRLAG